MEKETKIGLLVLIAIGLFFMVITAWISNTGFCMNYKSMIQKQNNIIPDATENFLWCAGRINYTK